MNDDKHESVQIKKNHITNGRMVKKINDLKTLVKVTPLSYQIHISHDQRDKKPQRTLTQLISHKNLTQTPNDEPNKKKKKKIDGVKYETQTYLCIFFCLFFCFFFSFFFVFFVFFFSLFFFFLFFVFFFSDQKHISHGTKDLKELSRNSTLIKISLKPPMMNPTTKNRWSKI